jgi:hypothetical protein
LGLGGVSKFVVDDELIDKDDVGLCPGRIGGRDKEEGKVSARVRRKEEGYEEICSCPPPFEVETLVPTDFKFKNSIDVLAAESERSVPLLKAPFVENDGGGRALGR